MCIHIDSAFRLGHYLHVGRCWRGLRGWGCGERRRRRGWGEGGGGGEGWGGGGGGGGVAVWCLVCALASELEVCGCVSMRRWVVEGRSEVRSESPLFCLEGVSFFCLEGVSLLC